MVRKIGSQFNDIEELYLGNVQRREASLMACMFERFICAARRVGR